MGVPMTRAYLHRVSGYDKGKLSRALSDFASALMRVDPTAAMTVLKMHLFLFSKLDCLRALE